MNYVNLFAAFDWNQARAEETKNARLRKRYLANMKAIATRMGFTPEPIAVPSGTAIEAAFLQASAR